MHRGWIVLAWLGAAFSVSLSVSAAAQMEWHGSYKSFFTVLEGPAFAGELAPLENPPGAEAAHAFRLKWGWAPEAWLRLDLAYALEPTLANNSALNDSGTRPMFAAAPYRWLDLANRLYPQPGRPVGHFSLTQHLDRANINFSFPFGDLTLGRQPIAMGSAHVINPSDVLAPFAFQALDTEERLGVDALRVRIPVGTLGEFDAGAVIGPEARRGMNAFFAKQRLNVWATDWTLGLIDFRDNLMLSVDLNRSIGGASVWLEAAFTWAGSFGVRQVNDDYGRVSLGVDYNLADQLYGFVEYHYNGAGRLHPGEYGELSQTVAYTQGMVYLLGQHYLAPGINYQATPLVTVTVQMIANLNDLSAYLAPLLVYNFAENATLEAGAFLAAGRSAEFRLDSSGTAVTRFLRSEFGLYPDTYFSSIKLYF